MTIWGTSTLTIQWTICTNLYQFRYQAKFEAFVKVSKSPWNSDTFRNNNYDITLEIHPSLQNSPESFLTEDQYTSTGTVYEEKPPWITTSYWLHIAANSYTQAQNNNEQPRKSQCRCNSQNTAPQMKRRWRTKILNSSHKLEYVQYLDAHILDIYAQLEELLQAEQPHTVFLDQRPFTKCQCTHLH